MLIRKASEKDIDAIMIMYGSLYKLLDGFGMPFALNSEELKDILTVMLKSKFCLIEVAEEDGIKGFVCAGIIRLDRKLRYNGQTLLGVINDIYVEPELRGRGVSAELLSRAEDWFLENDIKIVESYVTLGNVPSASFFKKNGYTDFSRVMYKSL